MEALRLWIRMSPNSAQTYPTRRGEVHCFGQQLIDSLSSSRFMKSIVARHKYGPLVLKIFIKPDSSMSLRVIQRRLKSESAI